MTEIWENGEDSSQLSLLSSIRERERVILKLIKEGKFLQEKL